MEYVEHNNEYVKFQRKIEQQYKGNYHLLALIDGKERKYVIRKKTAEHDEISRIGINNLSTEYLRKLVAKLILYIE